MNDPAPVSTVGILVDWETWEPNMRANLLFVAQGNRVLLIHKKRGIGAGKINGPGGKLEAGESPLEAAIREVEEELCITPIDPEEMGVLRFAFRDGLHLHCTVFRAGEFVGEPTETVEATPEWFDFDAIPYDRMWADDIHWLPGMLSGGKFDAWFEFDGETMLSQRIDWLA
ncbi:MAG: 8-oxo-dGTP diphosphatase [Verrucomicrobiae bacterium]|nr:8-oxo-dGTP diphosphatase [Verrucomicrobiae bacterium]